CSRRRRHTRCYRDWSSDVCSSDLDRATFSNMQDSTAEDWAIIGSHAVNFMVGLPDRVLAHLRLLSGDSGGFAVDRLTHSLQTARSEERRVGNGCGRCELATVQ